MYVERQGREYEKAFYEFDKDGSGTIEAGALWHDLWEHRNSIDPQLTVSTVAVAQSGTSPVPPRQQSRGLRAKAPAHDKITSAPGLGNFKSPAPDPTGPAKLPGRKVPSSGLREANELQALLTSIGITPMDQAKWVSYFWCKGHYVRVPSKPAHPPPPPPSRRLSEFGELPIALKWPMVSPHTIFVGLPQLILGCCTAQPKGSRGQTTGWSGDCGAGGGVRCRQLGGAGLGKGRMGCLGE